MQHARSAVSAGVTSLLLFIDAVLTVVNPGDHGLHGTGEMGPGFFAMGTALLAFTILDAGVKQWGSEDGVQRTALIAWPLLGMVWGTILVGIGHTAIVPAMVAMLWLFCQAALFTAPADDEAEEEA